MASSERLRRVLRLLELLQSGQSYDAQELSRECRVSRRTVFRDLALLQRSGLQLRYDQEQQGYVLPPRTFLPPTDLTFDETLSLLNLCLELGSDEGIPFRQSARSAALKLSSNLPADMREELENLPESLVIFQDARNPLTNARDDYELMLRAFREHRQVRLLYDSLHEGRKIDTVVNPYAIFFKRRSWYVIGRSSIHRKILTFNVGRILRAELLDSRYRQPSWFKLGSRLRNAFWMIRGEKSYTVTIRFSRRVARNVAEVHWHRTQKVIWNEDGTIFFRVRVDGLDEIVWWVFGYADEAEVIAPQELRRQLRQRAERIRRMYSDKPSRRRK